VVWRLREGGGAHEFFHGLSRDPSPGNVRLPTIARGMDINDLAEVTLKHVGPVFEATRRGEPKEVDSQAINDDLARLPHGPDERLD
jgi:hypothetical protein